MTDYRIRYAPDEMLGGRDFLLCSERRDGVTLFLREGMTALPHSAQAAILEQAWTAYRELAGPEIPAQRIVRSQVWTVPADLS